MDVFATNNDQCDRLKTPSYLELVVSMYDCATLLEFSRCIDTNPDIVASSCSAFLYPIFLNTIALFLGAPLKAFRLILYFWVLRLLPLVLQTFLLSRRLVPP